MQVTFYSYSNDGDTNAIEVCERRKRTQYGKNAITVWNGFEHEHCIAAIQKKFRIFFSGKILNILTLM